MNEKDIKSMREANDSFSLFALINRFCEIRAGPAFFFLRTLAK